MPVAPYAPAPAYAPAPYHPAPAPYHEEKIPPQPFAYEYGGADEYGRHFAKTETQDEHGVVKGEHGTTFTLYSRAIICKYLSLPCSVIGPPLDLNTISVKVYTSAYNAGTASDARV